MARAKSDLVDIEVIVITKTAKAVLLKLEEDEESEGVLGSSFTMRA